MHVLYIHQHFAVPCGTTGTRSYEFARRWVKAGHKVTLITGYYDIGGLELGRGLVQKQIIDQINVVIVGIRYSNKQSYLRRAVSFLSFIFFSVYVGLRTKKVDVIYTSSTPLTVGIPAMVIKWLKRIPFVFEVRDQWPEIPIELGIVKNKILIKILLWLEKSIYESATSIVALSPGMADGIRRVLHSQKDIVVIPNSCDTDIFRPDVDGSAIRKEYGWGDKLVFLHFGAMGKANGLDFVIDVARKLCDQPEIHFVLVGDGPEKQKLLEKVNMLHLKNLEILDPVSKKDLPSLVAACDVSMVIFANFPILEHNSANKFFDSLSAGKPVLLNYSGWQREIVEKCEAGFGCSLFNINEFIEKVNYLSGHSDNLNNMGKRAGELALKEFDRDILSAKVLSILESVTFG